MSDIAPEDSLFIIFSSADPEVARNMAFMYGKNAMVRGWWERVRLIIWGPSAGLVSRDSSLQGTIKDMLEAGVEVWACKACADDLGVADRLEALGIDVRYVGSPVTDMLKSGWKQLTF